MVDMRRQVWAGVVGTGPGGTQLNVSSLVGWLAQPCPTACMPACLPGSFISMPAHSPVQSTTCLTSPSTVPLPHSPTCACRCSCCACCAHVPPCLPAPLPACLPPRPQATFKNQNDLGFQDSVGRLLLESAQTIPDGLLVFMPSYAMLDRLMARWKVGGGEGARWARGRALDRSPSWPPATRLVNSRLVNLLHFPRGPSLLQTSGLLKWLGELKRVVQEPRGGGQDALKKTMAEYYAAIQGGGGAVFFAVCRGKVRVHRGAVWGCVEGSGRPTSCCSRLPATAEGWS